MVSSTAIRQGLRIVGKIDRKYNINKIFVSKYVPPGYRKTANTLIDLAGTVGGGYGLYNFAQTLLAPDTPGNDDALRTIQRKKQYGTKTYSQNKTRRRQSVCSCPSRGKFKRFNRYS